jgi:hypothetical protein
MGRRGVTAAQISFADDDGREPLLTAHEADKLAANDFSGGSS